MKIKMPVKGLSNMLSVVGRATARTTTMPLLTGILFKAKKGNPAVLELRASDMEISMSLAVPAQGPIEIEEEGSVVVPAALLSKIVSSLPEGEVVLETGGEDAPGDVSLTHGKNLYKLRSFASSEFPKIAEFPQGDAPDGGATFSVPAVELVSTVEKVLPSASKDNTRPALTGILVSFSEDKVHMVSTDTYRLSVKETPLEGGPKEEKKALIPARAMAEAAKLAALAGEGGTIAVALTENAALFSAGGVVMTARLIDGNYPNYKQIMPKDFEREFGIDAGELSDTLRRVGLFAGRQTPPAALSFEFSSGEGTLEGGTLTVSVDTAETGTATEKIGASVPEGLGKEGFRISFNGEYVAAGVSACGSGRVRLRCNEPMKPAIISPDPSENGNGNGSKKDRYAYMVMPMRDPKG